MNEKETGLKHCPYCGNFLISGNGTDPRTSCTCDGARMYCKILGDLEECCEVAEESQTSGYFRSITEETYTVLLMLADMIAGKRMTKATVTLEDGSHIALSSSGAKRKITIER